MNLATELRILLENKTNKRKFETVRKNQDYRQFLSTRYPQFNIDEDTTIMSKLFLDNLDELPTCARDGCSKSVRYDKNEIGNFCSTKCSNKQNSQYSSKTNIDKDARKQHIVETNDITKPDNFDVIWVQINEYYQTSKHDRVCRDISKNEDLKNNIDDIFQNYPEGDLLKFEEKVYCIYTKNLMDFKCKYSKMQNFISPHKGYKNSCDKNSCKCSLDTSRENKHKR